MKNLFLIIVCALTLGCTKTTETQDAGRPYPYWTPENPDLEIITPKCGYVKATGGVVTVSPIVGDNFTLTFTAKPGKDGQGDKTTLTKWRVSIDNALRDSGIISGKDKTGFTHTLPVTLTYSGLHQFGVTVWQADGGLSSQGCYVKN